MKILFVWCSSHRTIELELAIEDIKTSGGRSHISLTLNYIVSHAMMIFKLLMPKYTRD